MNAIGDTLKEARTKKDISLEEVHAKLKIHPRVLQILEEGKFEKLPSPLFVKSFLKTYADFLEVNSEELVHAYEKEGRKDPEQILFLKPAQERGKKSNAVDKNWLVIPLVILMLLILTGIVFFSVKALLSLTAHYAKSSESPRSPKASATKPTASKLPRDESKSSEQFLRSVELGNFPKISKLTPLELKLKATDNVWLKVTCDGKVLFQSILKRDTSESWVADKSIEIWTGNSASMTLRLNNTNLGSPGKGVVKKMIISREGVKIL